MSIFKSYDVRGTYPAEVNERAFYEIGRRLNALKIRSIAVAKDARLSSDSLSRSFMDGVLDAGIDVIDIGLSTSPILSYFCAKNKTYGAMITASHNPKEYNGIKFIDNKAIQISYEDGLKIIEKRLGKPASRKATKKGNLRHKRILNEYADHIVERFRNELKNDKKQNRKRLKAVFDCSNGVGGLPLFSLTRMNVDAIVINERPDGNFPVHACDQTKKENLAQLQRKVIDNRADLGVMFDGDADRCAFVDEKGDIVKLDLAFLLLALDEIKKYNKRKPRPKTKPKILFDLRFSRIVAEEIEKKEGTPVMMRVGNPFYKKKISKDNTAIAAGELSGHIMFRENYGIDDPFFASLKMISLLFASEEPMSQKIKRYDKYYSSGEMNYRVESKAAQESAIKKIIEAYPEKKKLHIDGITIIDDDWRMNLRASNTEQVLRLIIEGVNQGVVDAQKKVIEYLIGIKR